MPRNHRCLFVAKNLLALLPLATLSVTLCASETVQQPVVQTLPAERDCAIARANAAIARQDLVAYRGWLKYLIFRVGFDAEKHGADSAEAKASVARLAEWTAKIEADPQIITKLHGVQEWAYESEADGSGQPFKLNIPTDYNPEKPTPLSLYCHGYSGNHLEHAVGWSERTGSFEIGVLGRARGGFYQYLSERDVLDVLQYVKAHWNIDGNRVHINGGSMGGFASFWFGARHPDLWASSRPSCGFAMRVPMNNLLTVPVYSLHSKDDPVVSISLSNGPLEHLREIGGDVTIEETNGFGHAVWDFAEGNARTGAWYVNKVRPDAKDVRHLDFYATDATAARAWWAEVTSWGPRQRTAHFVLKAESGNKLEATLENVGILRLHLANSPFSQESDLQISVNGEKPFTVKAPLTDSIEIAQGANGWEAIGERAPLPYRAHTPGGAALVYDGSPILIVYGTQGTAEENAAILVAAKAASKSPNPSWPDDSIDPSPADGVSHYENLYGNLPMVADSDITDADIKRCNLVIIGTPAQNSLAARMAGELPVMITDDEIVCTNGQHYPAKNNALGLVYYNPLASGKLILWLASTESAFYKPAAVLPQLLSRSGFGIDMLVMGISSAKVVAARNFDNFWNWSKDCEDSALIKNEYCSEDKWARVMANTLRDAAKTDFGIGIRTYAWLNRANHALSATEGVTRFSDMAAFYAFDNIYTIEMSGAQIQELASKLTGDQVHFCELSDNFDANKIEADRTYSIAVIDESVAALMHSNIRPLLSRWTGINAADAILSAGNK